MKRKTILWLGALAAALCVCGALAVSAQPGDNSDPVVTKSYIDQVAAELRAYTDERTGGAQGGSSEGGAYQIVNISAGERITLGGGTECILRAGRGVIFSTDSGGIADVTAGVDLPEGEGVPSNHLLIVPRDDGRGFRATTDVIVMVRGSYQIW